MHEKAKETLGKIGTSHAPGNPMHEHSGLSHKEMHEIEGKHLEGKKHHHEML